MKLERIARTRILIAGALAVPVVLGSVAFANASSPHDNRSTEHGTSQLTQEGKDLAKGKPTSVSFTIDKDGVVTGGDSGLPPGASAPIPSNGTQTTFTGSAKLTEEGKELAKGKPTSGSVTAGPGGITKH